MGRGLRVRINYKVSSIVQERLANLPIIPTFKEPMEICLWKAAESHYISGGRYTFQFHRIWSNTSNQKIKPLCVGSSSSLPYKELAVDCHLEYDCVSMHVGGCVSMSVEFVWVWVCGGCVSMSVWSVCAYECVEGVSVSVWRVC